MKTSTKVAKGESDKMGDKRGLIGIIPSNVEEIPPVHVLQMCGKVNLERLLACVCNALQTGAESCQQCGDNCKVTCHESHLITTQILQDYRSNLQTAIELAEGDFPLLPDLRDRAWLDTEQPVAVYSVCASAKKGKWLDRIEAINPQLMPSESGYDVNFGVDESHQHEWSIDDSCSYDIHSPYIMTGAEETFFSTHPDALELWLNLCGNLYPEFVICNDVKDIFIQKISSLCTASAV